jgi:CheY-like chemotaxis protein
MRDASVLVVEDDFDIRESIAEALDDAGFRVATAAHGLEALSYLRGAADLPAVILLDLMMPVMSGFELVAELRGDARLAGIPIVLLSGDAQVSEAAKRLAAVAWIKKPTSVDKLVTTLDRVR